MKAIKKILATVMCLSLLLGCISMTAFAADPKGTITIKDPTSSEATVAGKTFEIYKIFSASTDGQNTSYSWFADKDAPQANPFYEFFATVKDSSGNALVTAGKAPAEYDNIQNVINHISTVYSTNYELSILAEEIHDYIVANSIAAEAAKTADANASSIVFDNLDYGYYLVYDATTLGTEDTKSAVRSAVMVDTVNSDIEITLKANRPELQKQVLENDGTTYGEATSAEVGEIVTFKIATFIPSHEYYKSYQYYIEDKLPEGLELVEGSVSVNINNSVVTDANFAEYCTVTENTTDDTFKVEFTNKALIGDDKLPTNTKIEITYDATVTAEIAHGRNTNTATLYYSNDPKEETSIGSVEDNAYVYTYMFVLTKYAIDQTGNVNATARLSGAKFEIYSIDENGVETLMTFTEVTNPKTGKPMYVVTGTVDELAVLDGTSPGQVSSASYYGGNLGDITIFGLKEGKYYIKETQAPSGYILPDDGFEITITDTIDANGNVSVLTATVGAHSSTGAIGNFGGEATTYLTYMDIGNTAGSMLPETGGMGTTLFTIVGIVLMAGAVAFFTSRKRSSVA